jgi:hypothetical protein
MTNFERIKAMDFDQMAEFLDRVVEDGTKTMDWELDEHGIEDDFDNPWTGVEEIALWLGLDSYDSALFEFDSEE